MAAQYIFTIENLSKAFGKKDVLKNIWLSFYPGAKIGVIGGNGSGKSTLLRIMAKSETDFIGTARPAPGISIGYLPQEPMLDPTRDVRGNVEIAVAPIRAHLTRFDEIKASGPISGRRYPACRLALSPAAAIDLINRMQQVAAALTQSGTAKPRSGGTA